MIAQLGNRLLGMLERFALRFCPTLRGRMAGLVKVSDSQVKGCNKCENLKLGEMNDVILKA